MAYRSAARSSGCFPFVSITCIRCQNRHNLFPGSGCQPFLSLSAPPAILDLYFLFPGQCKSPENSQFPVADALHKVPHFLAGEPEERGAEDADKA